MRYHEIFRHASKLAAQDDKPDLLQLKLINSAIVRDFKNKMHILKKFMIFSLFFIIPLFVSGYGYTGELPVLGGKSKIEKQPEIQVENEIPEIKPDSIIIPRPSVGHKTNKYSTYLADIREIENLLKEIKTILQNHDRDKIQLFCAKVNLLNLYTDTLEKKYGARPEKYYESYRQLLILDN